MRAMDTKKLRTYRRQGVRWPVILATEDAQFIGDVCDVSARGVFVRPFVRNETPLVFVGDELQFRCRLPIGDRTLHGVVRWVGWSKEHQCRGFGFELHRDEPALEECIGVGLSGQVSVVGVDYGNPLAVTPRAEP